MERVVYLLGAGFSAPLGLPVMSNFLEKSKDLYFGFPGKYAHFESVLRTITEMSVVKNYYRTDLLNIEEILSILAMEDGLSGKRARPSFLRYISDVINHFTPAFPPYSGRWSGKWHRDLFPQMGPSKQLFGTFAGNVLGLSIEAVDPNIFALRASGLPRPTTQYGIVTLNYDLVLERMAEHIQKTFSPGVPVGFMRAGIDPPSSGLVPLAKLHGSADTGVLVPPTWNKTLSKKLVPTWKAAYDLLVNANHLRIIGYSLPTADAYIKYLLRAAVIKAAHLKRIDVLCLDDPRGSVRARYEDFVDFARYRFVNASVVDYFELVSAQSTGFGASPQIFQFDDLERAHEEFFVARAA